MNKFLIGLKDISLAIVGGFMITSSAYAGSSVYYGIQLDELEYRFGDTGDEITAWSSNVFVGPDELKIHWASEAEYATKESSFEKLENQILLQKPISDFFDLHGGVRFDSPKGPDRWYGVVGVSGIAPQWIDVDANFFLSEKGDASLRLDTEYELLITNKLILTPTLEINYAFSEDAEIGSGTGLNDAELGMRLSYDILDRAISPFMGVLYEHKFGDTADFSKEENSDTKGWSFLVGTKLLF